MVSPLPDDFSPRVLVGRFLARLIHQWRGCVVGAISTILLGAALLLLPLAYPLSIWSYELLFNVSPSDASVPEDVVVVYMDEASHRALDQPFDQPWDRSLHARLLRRLSEAGSKAVVFDIVFAGDGPDPAADAEFAEAIAGHGSVILGGEVVHYEEQGVVFEGLLAPHEPFRNAAAAWGLVQLVIDGRSVRQHWHDSTDEVPSISWAAAELAGASETRTLGARSIPRWLRYYGPPGTLPSVSFHQALHEDGVPPGFFKDKTVFIGARQTMGFSGTGMDEFATPFFTWMHNFSPSSLASARPIFSPGVDIHATSFLNLLHGDWLRQIAGPIELSLVIACGLFCGVLMVPIRPVVAAGLGMTLVVLIVFAAWLLFWSRGIWFSWLIPVIQVGAALSWAVLYNSMQWYVERRVLTQTLSLHLSPARARVVMNQPELLRPGAEMQTISILFSDIAGFSGVAEKMAPNDLAKLLNSYFETSISSIHEHDGTVVKLIGDAIFAIWNAPVGQEDHHVRACRAALHLRDQLVGFVEAHRELPPLRTRIALHTGPACVGNFGSSTRFDYTAIGDAVNLASRLEGLNKFLGTDVLMTSPMLSALEGKFVARALGRFRFKGFGRAIEVHELIGCADEHDSSAAWRSLFGEALAAYQKHDFTAAARLFQESLEQRPNDGPASFYLRNIEELEETASPAEWDGEVVLQEK